MTEKNAWTINGFLGILIIILFAFAGFYFLYNGQFLFAVLCLVVTLILASGITIVPPNKAKVLLFFGKYMGSIRNSGLFFTVPLTNRWTISLRVRNFNSSKLKVNDVDGNPIEIAAVVVFKVVDSAKAVFDVDDYEEFVEIQSETAIRHVATKYPYDTFEVEEVSLAWKRRRSFPRTD